MRNVSMGMVLRTVTLKPFLPQDLGTCHFLGLECSVFILYLIISFSSSVSLSGIDSYPDDENFC